MWLYRCHLEFSSLVTSRKVQINKFLLNTREQYSIDVQIIDTCNTELVFITATQMAYVTKLFQVAGTYLHT